jgi:hypothetical protein
LNGQPNAIAAGMKDHRLSQHSFAIGLLLLAGVLALAQESTGTLRGTVVVVESDGAQSAVPGASVTLSSVNLSRKITADERGSYSFATLPTGRYEIEAVAPGLRGSALVDVADERCTEVVIVVAIEALKDAVTVNANAEPAILADPQPQAEITRSTMLNAPSKDDRAETLLALIPGVVRGPDGLMNMKGTRSSQSGSLVNSASVIDPVTGNPAMSLPIDVVESAKVIANPYDPEYGRLAGAVSKVETTTGNFNKLHATVQNLFVRPRKRGGDFVGIESATPRTTITGPLVKDRIAFTESFEYRFVRTPVGSLPPLQRDMKFEGLTWFNQVDINLDSRQTMTASFSLQPQKVNYLGLNTFTPQPSTPDLHQRGYMAAVQHRLAVNADSLLVSQFSIKQFDVDVTANSAAPYELSIETTTGGFFDRQARRSKHIEWRETYQFERRGPLGAHSVKVGTDYAHDSYDGRTTLMPVTVAGVASVPVERVEFGPATHFHVPQNSIAWFVADEWRALPRLTLNLGLRFDRDSITDDVDTAPRAGFALRLTRDSRTVLKGGAGLFYSRVPLNVASFPLLPDRTVASLSPAGEVLSSQTYVNASPLGLKNPRSAGWNVELDRQVTQSLTVRAGFQVRNTTSDFVLNPRPGLGLLTISNDGRSYYREFQVTMQYKLRRAMVNASYVRSKAYGNLNDFNQFFGNNAAAVINPDASGRLPFDAPNRVLAWGQWSAPFKLEVLPVLDVHSGFPYSRTDERREFVGPRNVDRFPRFASLDFQVLRPVALHFGREKLKTRVGFSVFNVLNHFTPRDVQSDIDSQRFGAMFNGVGRTWRGKLVLEF